MEQEEEEEDLQSLPLMGDQSDSTTNLSTVLVAESVVAVPVGVVVAEVAVEVAAVAEDGDLDARTQHCIFVAPPTCVHCRSLL